MSMDTTKYKPYPAYKDSGIEWLGEVPANWEVKPIKRIASSNDDVLNEKTPDEYEIEYVDISSVNEVEGIIKTEEMIFKNAPSRARRLVRDGDVIVSTVRTYLKAIAPIKSPNENWVVSTGFAVIRPNKKLLPAFAAYLFKAHYLIELIISRSVGVSYPAINSSDLVSLKTALPSLVEQQTIAAFLDRETTKIDTLIAKQERLIELLGEKRTALISHAVTKGLNPDAPMKDSGVEWLGKVPEHWQISRNKVVFSEVDDRSQENNGELLTVSHLTGVTLRSEKNVNMFMAETLEGYKKCQIGDLVINTMWAWMGALGISPCNGLVSPSYNVYRIRDFSLIFPKYYDYLCRIPTHIVIIKAYSTGIWESRLRLYPDVFLGMEACLPPFEEQKAIVEFLNDQTAKIDTLITKARHAIDLLKERRTALISAAVTGKIDVREIFPSDDEKPLARLRERGGGEGA